LYFRIVSAKYKKKKYHYLRVMESYRRGKKVKQKELLTLASLSRISPDKIQLIMSELKKFQDHCSMLNKNASGCAWVSLLVALEMVFQPKKPCPLPAMQQILNKKREKREDPLANKEEFFDCLRQSYPSVAAGNGDLILYIDELHEKEEHENQLFGYLVNITGFPLCYFFITQDVQNKQNLGSFITSLYRLYNTNNIITVIPGKVLNTRQKDFSLPEFEVLTHNLDCRDIIQPGDKATIFVKNDSAATILLPDVAVNICDSYDYLQRISLKISNISRQYLLEPEEHLDMCIMAHSLAKLIESNIAEKLQLSIYRDKKPGAQVLHNPKLVP